MEKNRIRNNDHAFALIGLNQSFLGIIHANYTAWSDPEKRNKVMKAILKDQEKREAEVVVVAGTGYNYGPT